MSTTGNENEQPGVSDPDRGDAGSAATSTSGEAAIGGDQRSTEGENAETPQQREVENPEQAAGVPGAGAAEPGWSGSFPPASDEPSHEAVGIGVIDDENTESAQSGTAASDAQAAGHHQGQDGGRETMTVGEAQRKGGLGTEQEQNLPAMSQNNASDVEKVSGIVVQTRDDIASTQPERVYDVLKQRLEQSGIDLPDSDIQELARQITTGDA
jgi:hypothetical protein